MFASSFHNITHNITHRETHLGIGDPAGVDGADWMVSIPKDLICYDLYAIGQNKNRNGSRPMDRGPQLGFLGCTTACWASQL